MLLIKASVNKTLTDYLIQHIIVLTNVNAQESTSRTEPTKPYGDDVPNTATRDHN